MKNIPLRKFSRWFNIILLSVVLFGCVQQPSLWDINSSQQVIADYVAANPGQYSEFGKILKSTGLNALLSVRGPFTLFLPTDEAMLAYYKEHPTVDFTNIDVQKKLVLNHLVANTIPTGDFMLGALRDTNAIGDYLVTEFQGADITVNKVSKIVKRDIIAANGYIHVISTVIDPVTSSVYDKIASDPSYSLFAEGLKRTGLKDTLQIISFPYGKKKARTRFTVLAVADTTFNRYGIKTPDDLIARFTNRPDSITYLKNGFYRYMEYHCMGGTYYLSDFKSRLYPILSSDNNISVTIDTDYRLNIDRVTKAYTGFNVDQSNIPAKNGALHAINDLLPVTEPAPTLITFEVTDYFDMKQGDYYGKYYMKWFDGQNTFAKIKWEADYLCYYYKNHDTGTLLNWDCLSTNGFWWVEVTTPKIMKGKYKLSGNIWSGQTDYDVYVDGIKMASIKKTDASPPPLGDYVWPKTEEHKVKLVATSWGMLFWDTLTFTPKN